MLIILRYVLILIVILSVACKDSLITTEEVPAGRRDYVWEVDSIGNNYKNRIVWNNIRLRFNGGFHGGVEQCAVFRDVPILSI